MAHGSRVGNSDNLIQKMGLQLSVDITAFFDDDAEQIVRQHRLAQNESLDSFETPIVPVVSNRSPQNQRNITLNRHEEIIEMVPNADHENLQWVSSRPHQMFGITAVAVENSMGAIRPASGPFYQLDNVFSLTRSRRSA